MNKYLKILCLQLACKYLDKTNPDNISSLQEIVTSITVNYVNKGSNDSVIEVKNFKDWICSSWNIVSSDADHLGLKIRNKIIND